MSWIWVIFFDACVLGRVRESCKILCASRRSLLLPVDLRSCKAHCENNQVIDLQVSEYGLLMTVEETERPKDTAQKYSRAYSYMPKTTV
jgi:hypothetical protein